MNFTHEYWLIRFCKDQGTQNPISFRGKTFIGYISHLFLDNDPFKTHILWFDGFKYKL